MRFYGLFGKVFIFKARWCIYKGNKHCKLFFIYILHIVPRTEKTFLSDFHSSELVQCDHDKLTDLESDNSAVQLAFLTPCDLENIILN